MMDVNKINDEELERVNGGFVLSKGNDGYYHKNCPQNGTMEYTAMGVRCNGCGKSFRDTSEFVKK